jgi:hypothetical protein
MSREQIPHDRLSSELMAVSLSDTATRDHLASYLKRQQSAPHDEWRRRPNQMFWPPRVVSGVRDDSLNIFFGSGISLAAGLADWTGLLRQVGVDAETEKDPNASGDLLTLAELAAHAVGADRLQATIRQAVTEPRRLPTTAHALLAALHLPLYLTTNYDCLFEDAVEAIHKFRPEVITNDLDVRALLGDDPDNWDAAIKARLRCCIVKLHGSIERRGEHLILTRSDYRRHYRSNQLMLRLVRYALRTRHTLFLGFSHRDPEVARIIEDVIFEAENLKSSVAVPGFYSLQFDMLQRTPEIFAARGIVALQPSLVLSATPGADVRSCSLAQGLADLTENADVRLDEALSLDEGLHTVSHAIALELRGILGQLESRTHAALTALQTNADSDALALVDQVLIALGEFANQGVYLIDRHGRVVAAAAHDGLDATQRRNLLKNVQERPYFRLAQSNRRPFVSDVFESKFNGNATVAACLPLLEADRFRGLVFAAFQLNDSGLVARLRSIETPAGASLLVTDANGLLVLPPLREIVARVPSLSDLAIETEALDRNVGFSYGELLQISRRDKRIDRLMQNVVPLAQDDDVHMLAPDIVSYSVVTELQEARWKVALTRYLRIRDTSR